MRILYAITKSNWGGAQRYLFDLACFAKEEGHEVSVLLGGEGALVEKLAAKGIRTTSLQRLGRDIKLSDEISSFFSILKILKSENPDVFHVNSSKMGGLGALAGRLSGVKKIVFTAHGWPFWEKRNIISRSLIWLFSWITALLSHKVIVVSDYDARVAQKMPLIKNKIVRIYNGIDFSTQFGDGKVVRDAFPQGGKIVGTVGELNNNKNQIALIEKARSDQDMLVAIVGEGENRKFLENKIKEYRLEDRVKLFGFLRGEDVMKGFDVFALPSLKEGLPYVLIEAKLAGLEIEANRIGGIGEILDQDISNFSLENMLRETFNLYRSL